MGIGGKWNLTLTQINKPLIFYSVRKGLIPPLSFSDIVVTKVNGENTFDLLLTRSSFEKYINDKINIAQEGVALTNISRNNSLSNTRSNVLNI